MKRVSGVYKITNLINGKFYIGASVDIGMRYTTHKETLLMDMNGDIVKCRDYPSREYTNYWYVSGSGELR